MPSQSVTLASDVNVSVTQPEIVITSSDVRIISSEIEDALQLHRSAADPHSPYVLADGSRSVSGTLTMNSAVVTNSLTAATISTNTLTTDTVTLNTAPSNDNHAVTKLYVDNTVGLISNSHSNLDDLDSDDHPQYLTAARGNLIYEPLGEAQAVIASHVTKPDPHPQYLKTTSGDSRYSLTTHNHDLLYSPLSHNHDSEYSLIGHEHGITDIVDLTTTLATKLEPSNIVAGSNISLSVSGNNITINSSGGTSNTINVMDYGATGDGVTDDTAAIQSAITGAGAGAVIYFPAGTYIVSSTLFPLNGQTFLGKHNPKYIKEDDPSSSCVIKAHTTFTGRAMIERQAGSFGVKLDSLCFWGQGDTTGTLHGIHLGDMTAERSWMIDNCTIHGFAGHGVTGRLHVFDMRDTHVARCGWGLRMLSDHAMTDVRITNCQFYYNLDGGIGMEGTRRNGAVEITGCRIERSGNTPGNTASPRNSNAPGIKIVNAQNLVLSQVSTDANTGIGLEIDAPRTNGQFVYAVSIVGCNFIRDGGGDQTSPQIPGVKFKGCDNVMMVGSHVTWGESDDGGGGPITPYYSLWLEDTQFVKVSSSWFTAHVAANSVNMVGTNWRSQIESPALNLSSSSPSTDTARESSPPVIGNWYYSTTTDRPLFWDGSQYRDAIGKPEAGSNNILDLDGGVDEDKAVNYFSNGVLKWATAVNPDASGGSWALRLHDPVTGTYDYDFIRATNDDTIRFPNTQIQAQKQGTALQIRSFNTTPTGSFLNVGLSDGTPKLEVLWDGTLRSNWGSPNFAMTQVGSLQVVRNGAGSGNTLIGAYTSTANASSNTHVFNVEGNGRVSSSYNVQSSDADTVMANKGYVDASRPASVLDYGADPTGVATSDTAFANAISNNSIVIVPAGTYRITQPIALKSGVSIIGDVGSRDAGDATPVALIRQDSDAEFFTGVDLRGVTLKELHLKVNTPASHTKDGVVMTRSSHAATNYITVENVHVVGVGRDGFSISNLIVSAWKGVTVVNAGRHGFNFYGVEGGAAGTSVSLDACYANTCGEKQTGHGFKFRKMVYCSLQGCASEGNSGASYHLSQVQAFTLSGCGSEFPKSDSYVIDDTCLGVTLTGCWAYLNVATAFKVTNNCQVQLIGCVEIDPTGTPVASISTDNTSTGTVVSPTYVTNMNLGTKTVLINEGTGGLVVPGTGYVGGNFTAAGSGTFDSLLSYGAGTFQGDLVSQSDLYARASIQIGPSAGNYNDLYRDASGRLHTSGAMAVDGNLWTYGDVLGGWAYFQFGADFGSSRITGVGTPTADGDAATKLYVDQQIAAAIA